MRDFRVLHSNNDRYMRLLLVSIYVPNRRVLESSEGMTSRARHHQGAPDRTLNVDLECSCSVAPVSISG